MNPTTTIVVVRRVCACSAPQEDGLMGDQSGFSVHGSGSRQHSGRAALLAGLLVLALAPWSSGPAPQARAAGPTTAGSGTAPLFGCPQTYAVGSYPVSVAVGDFNGDGKPDLVTANNESNNVSVLLGNGDGTFQPHQDYAVGSFPYSVAVGDFNGDGKQDLATAANNGYPNGAVSVLLGNGDGTFQPYQDYAVGFNPQSVAVGDFNGDGKLDLATANSQSNYVSVLLGNGDGTFQNQRTFPLGADAVSVTAGDFNGDGKQDLVTANNESNTVSVLLGNGDGTFQPHQDYAVGSRPQSVAVGDLNGDGKLDLVAANSFSSNVSVLLGNGDGTFQGQRTFRLGFFPHSVIVGDFNGDGKQDLATAANNGYPNGAVSVLLGNGDGTFQPRQTYAVGLGPSSVAVGDVNNDGKEDLVTANAGSNNVSVLLNGGPCLTASPTSGYPTKAITLGGVHFGASEAVNVYWDGTATPPLTRTTTDASGAFTATARVPLTPYGTHTIIGVGQTSGLSSTAPFQVVPIIVLAPTSGLSGTVVTARGAGFGASETVTLTWSTTGAVLGTTATSAKGSFGGPSAIHFTVPSASPGSYKVCGKGQTTLAQSCATFTVTG